MKRTISALLLLLLCLGLASGCKKSYTVQFDLNGGTLIFGELEQTVPEGEAASAPLAENGRLSLSWDKDFSNIQDNCIVTAQWEKVAMAQTDLAEYVQQRTVTVSVQTITGSSSVGSGFFIDDQGTIVTNYHVIDMGSQMSVQVSDSGSYDVEKIIDFSPVYDLAILKIDITGNPYLDIRETPAKTGEQVYAVGSALGVLTGSFTTGTISSVSRTVGLIDCIQMDAAISHGNSGGPLVDAYGEVVGINTFSYTSGESLNLAIKPTVLDRLSRDKNYTVNDFREWYSTESSRSYSPYDGENFYYSLINTYQYITGKECIRSIATDGDYKTGYRDCMRGYAYDYDVASYDSYVAYLKSIGFVFDQSENFDGGISYYYYDEREDVQVDLFISSDESILLIFVTE